MKKKLLTALLAATMALSSIACSQPDTDQISTDVTESNSKTLHGYTYDVPASWTEDGSTDDTHFFYPENAMLMVAFSPMDESISNEFTREIFISGFGSTFGNFEILSESEIVVANSIAYQHEALLEAEGEEWLVSMVTLDCADGIITFFMSTLNNAKSDYKEDFNTIIKSITNSSGVASAVNLEEESNDTADVVRDQVEIKAIPTLDGLMCVFITNNSKTIIDELGVQINYLDENGTIINLEKDGFDMVLPGSTVVARMDTPEVYSNFEIVKSVELDIYSDYQNHAENVILNSNQGDECIIVEITNNSDITLDEVEYIAVLYMDDQIVTVEYPKDIYDVASGQTVTEKIDTSDTEYNHFEIYLNQAHTFGF